MNTPSSTICVCGAGTMGRGISLACALHGFRVVLFDLDPDAMAAAKAYTARDVQYLVEKKKLYAGNEILERISFTSHLSDCVGDVVIEAVIEKMAVKVSLFNQLAEINNASTVFATNTSSLSVTEIARQISRPRQLAGMHFFNPATVMKLVEVVETEYSSPETVDAISKLAKDIGKTPVRCKDDPGFIVNHVARPYYLEALHLAEHHEAGIAEMDALMESSGFKMGPFRLMDLIGNDINYTVSCTVYDALGQPERLRPSSIQKRKVDAGELGRKTGKGYYVYHQ